MDTKKKIIIDQKEIFLGEDRVLPEAIDRKKKIEICLEDLEQRIQMAPEGSLRVSFSNKNRQFYQRMDLNDPRGKYLTKEENSTAQQLARKAFYLKLQKALKKQLSVLNNLLDYYNPSIIYNIYEGLSEDRKQLINPVVMSDGDYAELWLSQKYTGKNFRDGAPEYYTNAGERVRSKSEIIIADKFSKHGIPYRYEYPIITSNGILLYPDFYCLNIKKRKVIIWEHFGMMDEPDYAENAVEKLDLYFDEGFIIGDNLIVTFETRKTPLNVRMVEDYIKLFLL